MQQAHHDPVHYRMYATPGLNGLISDTKMHGMHEVQTLKVWANIIYAGHSPTFILNRKQII